IAMTTLVPLQTSAAVGRVKVQGEPHSNVALGAQVISGAPVSTTVMVWLQSERLPQSSVADQVRVALKVFPHSALVTVPITEIAISLALHSSVAAGRVNIHPMPHSTVVLGAQVIVGGVVSTTVMRWLHWDRFLQASVADQ